MYLTLHSGTGLQYQYWRPVGSGFYSSVSNFSLPTLTVQIRHVVQVFFSLAVEFYHPLCCFPFIFFFFLYFEFHALHCCSENIQGTVIYSKSFVFIINCFWNLVCHIFMLCCGLLALFFQLSPTLLLATSWTIIFQPHVLLWSAFSTLIIIYRCLCSIIFVFQFSLLEIFMFS